ncbi:hypothetical protein QEJ31_12940 [Pigmentibacter sp. JX0631]|uniref:hypothetical protein n=1 Tax=Pigmentibacter sp. JX0631 TaxID=2976982 RepID=UPI002468C529|nr:hypothetical protein [Pigmentibacter sp. JX0631]WGL59430.1 hypothetical protein QEJ31_12940 [Pigmentibacter sp. JX0631]
MPLETILLTGELHHRYVEDTLTCLGAPEGFVIRFDYRKKYKDPDISNPNIDDTVYLFSYKGKIEDKNWFPTRIAKIKHFFEDEDSYHYILELKNSIVANESCTNHSGTLKEFQGKLNITAGDMYHIRRENISTELILKRELPINFKEIVDYSLRHSELLKSKDIIFSTIYLLDKNNKKIILKYKTRKKNVDSFTPKYQLPFSLCNLINEINIKIEFYSPNIGIFSHKMKIDETISSSNKKTHSINLGARQDIYITRIPINRSWLPREASFEFLSESESTFTQRLKIKIPLQINIGIWILISITLLSYACISSTKNICSFYCEFIKAIITVIVLKILTRDK